MSSTTPTVYVFNNNAEISDALDSFVASLSKAAIAKSGRFTIAISGGSLPTILAAKLVSNTTVDWSKWHVFFADERCVPHNHPDSNYDLARQSLLDRVPIPTSQVHAIKEELVGAPEEAAKEYTRQLYSVFGGGKMENICIDLILLGMGPDGHTCSLFPGHVLLEEISKPVASLTDSPKPPPERITLTYPVLANAGTVAFVATGESKADMLHRIFDLGDALPSGRVRPRSGELFWFVDSPAVKGVSKKTQSFNKL